jgi:hypothetical protein
LDIVVFEELNSTLGQVNVILKSPSLDEKKQNEILGIKDKLLNIYSLSKVEENIGYSLSKNVDFEVEKKEINKQDNAYERSVFQEHYAKILFLKSKFEDISYQINVQEKNLKAF